MNQRATGVLDRLRFLTANVAISKVSVRGWAVWTGTLSLCGGDEHTGETQCGESGLQASSGVLGKLSASDAHCPGLAGSVPRLLGGKQVHGGSGPAAGEVQRADPGAPSLERAAQTLFNGTWWGPSSGAGHSPWGRRF